MARLQIIVSRPDGHPSSAQTVVTRHLDGLSIEMVAQIARALEDHIDDEVKYHEDLMCSCDATSASVQACSVHGISASNARQSDYWQRVGGHD